MSKKRTPAKSPGTPTSFAFGAAAAAFGSASSGAFSTSASSLSYAAEPPDLSGISDSSVVVLFKNLSKKDETTKSRALEELQAKLASSEDVEEAVTAAWVRIYPRLSTDISRRVRQLSHVLLKAICQKNGKRIAKYMPKLVGPWLSGQYDNDRGVARAATDALHSVFNSREKMKSVWRVYQGALLEYSVNVLTGETVSSLSDERSVSPDDAEAKFTRVMASTIFMLASVQTELPSEEVGKYKELHYSVVTHPTLAAFTHHPDAFLRRSVYALLQADITTRPGWVLDEIERVGSTIIMEAITFPQIGSVMDLLNLLVRLTETIPSVWTQVKPSKNKTAISQLLRFIRAGSQLGPPEYWDQVSKLMEIIPIEILPRDVKGCQDLMRAIRIGIRDPPEPRTHIVAAWNCYFSVAFRLLDLDDIHPEADEYLLKEGLYYLFTQYLTGSQEKTEYIIPEPFGSVVLAHNTCKTNSLKERTSLKLFQGTYAAWNDLLAETMRVELGKVSADPVQLVAAELITTHLVNLAFDYFEELEDKEAPMYKLLEHNVNTCISISIHNLVATKGGAVGNALFLKKILSGVGPSVLAIDSTRKDASEFFFKHVTALLDSPSAEHLIVAFVAYGVDLEDSEMFSQAWKNLVHTLLLSSLEKKRKEDCISKLLNSVPPSLKATLRSTPELDAYVVNKLHASLEGEDEAGWEVSKSAFHLAGTAISQDASMKMLIDMTSHLNLDGSEKTLTVCKELDVVAHNNPAVVAAFINTEDGKDLLSKLLILTDSGDDALIAAAESASHTISRGLSTEAQNESNIVQSMVDILKKGITDPGDDLSLDYLAARCQNLISNEQTGERAALAESMLFYEEEWEEALKPYYKKIQNVSLAITNPLTSCVYLIDEQSTNETNTEELAWDDQGFSKLLRMSYYCLKSIEILAHDNANNEIAREVWAQCSDKIRIEILLYIAVCYEVAKDNLTIAGTNPMWNKWSHETEAEILEYMAIAEKYMRNRIKSGYITNTSSVHCIVNTVDRLIARSHDCSPRSFYMARALHTLMSQLTEHRQNFREKAEEWIISANVSNNDAIFCSTAMLSGSQSMLPHALKDRLRNELINALLGLSASKASSEGLQKLILLNAMHPEADEGVVPLPQPRVMFLLKHLLSWFDEGNVEVELSPAVITESARAFTGLIPVVKTMYGEHWELLLDFIKNCWMGCIDLEEEHLPMVFSTLKLFQALQSFKGENDDFEDAWATYERPLYDALLSIFLTSRRPDDQHQPRKICNTQIARQIRKIDLRYIDNDPGALYALMKTKSASIQEAVYDILHRMVPAGQEQVSIDAALAKDDDTNIQLPPELLSIIMDAPHVSQTSVHVPGELPLDLRGYLLSWILIFDHFQNSTFKVKSAYVEILKEGRYLIPLLELIFKFLFPHRQPFDASQFKFESYTPGIMERASKDIQWLLTHLYYLSLRHTPSLTKAWWLECKNRATVQTVENFTEKYMSPLLISTELASVAEWAQTRDADGEEGMQIKVSRVAREVTASYPVDDQAMEIIVRMPATFPLRHVEVEGLRRVGLDEKQFKKMQLASQAVVNFWSGSIIDALTVFRKNVSLHFQGISECAICYSILAITPDRSLPNKACTTCKNKFHSTCLWKWFKSSNSSSCPLCRTSFSFYS